MGKNKTIPSEQRTMILRVLKFFEEEKRFRAFIIPVDQVLKRTCAATGVSKNTVLRIKKEEKKILQEHEEDILKRTSVADDSMSTTIMRIKEENESFLVEPVAEVIKSSTGDIISTTIVPIETEVKRDSEVTVDVVIETKDVTSSDSSSIVHIKKEPSAKDSDERTRVIIKREVISEDPLDINNASTINIMSTNHIKEEQGISDSEGEPSTSTLPPNTSIQSNLHKPQSLPTTPYCVCINVPKIPTPGKKRRPKKKLVDDAMISGLKKIVDDFNAKNEKPTLNEILAVAKKEMKFPAQKETLRKILFSRLGYKFKK